MRAVIKRVGGAVAGAMIAAATLAAPAQAEPASLSGTITAGDTGAPLSACVSVYGAQDWSWVGSACADETGQWTVDGLEAGLEYKVEAEVWDGMYLSEWADGARSYEEATVYSPPAQVDITLDQGGRMEGTLLRADGSPAEWASIDVVTADGSTTVGWAWTDDTGAWSTAVPPGDYLVRFDSWPATQWAFGKESAEQADVLTVAAGEATRVDDQFLAGASVAGTVVADGTGEPVEGACVSVVRPGSDDDNVEWAGEGCTDAEGHYSVDLSSAGTYTAEIYDPQGGFAGELNGDTLVRADATTFEAVRGATTTLDASLAPGAVITGRAVDAKTGLPISGACPAAYRGHAGGYARWQVDECSAADGAWTVRGLPAGEFAMRVDVPEGPSPYAGTWAFRSDTQAGADLVAVTAGETTATRNVKLVPGGTVSGRITDHHGRPVAGAWVNMQGGYPGRAGPGEGRWTAQTDEDGRYTVQGVPPGDYTPFVYADFMGDLAPEWSGNATSRAEAAPVRVKALKTTTFDADLGPAAHISGSVVHADGSPTSEYWVGLVFTTAGEYIGDFDVYNGNTFTSTALPAGDVVLQLANGETGESFWYDGATSREDATVVSLQQGERRELTVHAP